MHAGDHFGPRVWLSQISFVDFDSHPGRHAVLVVNPPLACEFQQLAGKLALRLA